MADIRPPIKEFRARVVAREILLGMFIKSFDFATLELLGIRTDLDFVILDLEHSSYTYRELHACILAAKSCSLPVLVRVASFESEYVSQSMDAGASGVMFPRISSEEEAVDAVARTKFQNGGRGFSLSHRSAQYGALTQEQYVEKNDGGVLRAMQIEDPEGADDAEKIAAAAGVDLIFVGPADLALALSLSTGGNSDLESQIGKIAQRSMCSGTTAGIFLPNAANLENYIELGFSLFVMSTDQAILTAGVNSMVANFKQYV